MVSLGRYSDDICLGCGAAPSHCRCPACCDQGAVVDPLPCPWHGEPKRPYLGTLAQRDAAHAAIDGCDRTARIVDGTGRTVALHHPPGECDCLRAVVSS